MVRALGAEVMRALCLALLLLASPAWGQEAEPHQWIMDNPGYVTYTGTHCCGPSHCRPARSGEVVRQSNGWLHTATGTTLKDDQKGIYDSEDGRTWICATTWLRCLFLDTRI